ncbi:MAG: c-type cytochrome [Gemmatimonadota bacterium]
MKKTLGSAGGLWVGLLLLPVATGMTLLPEDATAAGTMLEPAPAATLPHGRFGPETSGMTIFKQHCAICHGEEGRGDGPAAAGIRPAPANFTDPERVADLSFEEMVHTVTTGKGYMPAFGSVLRPEEIREVVTYIRTLKHEGGG